MFPQSSTFEANTPSDISSEDFVRSIRELGVQNDREDMERYHMLELETQKRRARKEGGYTAAQEGVGGRRED